MFEIGWSEMLLCAIIALLVVGPKDLPHMMRSFGRWVAQLRGLASQFQRSMEEAAREMDSEELRQAKKGFSDLRSLRNPFDAAIRGVNDALNKPVDSKTPETKAPETQASEAKPPAPQTPEAKIAEAPAPALPTPSPPAAVEAALPNSDSAPR